MMMSGDMFVKDKSKTGTARGPRARTIGAVKAFGQAGYIFWGNADARVFDLEKCLASGGLLPVDSDFTALRGITHCIINQITKGRTEFSLGTHYIYTVINLDVKMMSTL